MWFSKPPKKGRARAAYRQKAREIPGEQPKASRNVSAACIGGSVGARRVVRCTNWPFSTHHHKTTLDTELRDVWLGFLTAQVLGGVENLEVAEALGLVWRPLASCTRLAARSPVATWGDNRGPRIAGAPRKTRTLRQRQRTQVGHQRGGGAPLGGGPPLGKSLRFRGRLSLWNSGSADPSV